MVQCLTRTPEQKGPRLVLWYQYLASPDQEGPASLPRACVPILIFFAPQASAGRRSKHYFYEHYCCTYLLYLQTERQSFRSETNSRLFHLDFPGIARAVVAKPVVCFFFARGGLSSLPALVGFHAIFA